MNISFIFFPFQNIFVVNYDKNVITKEYGTFLIHQVENLWRSELRVHDFF